jgi:hypothetical protein
MTTNPKRFAAAATEQAEDDLIDVQEGDDEAHELFEQWSAWCRTRRFYAPPSNVGSILGQLRGPSRPSRLPPNAKCSTGMAALHLAIKGQPEDALDTKVFWLYYGERTGNIKQAAYVLGISRQHFYRLLRSFTDRVRVAAKQIEADNVAAGEALPHRAQAVE